MKLKLLRTNHYSSCTEGKLFIDNELFCDTLEPTERQLNTFTDKVRGRTAIPRGIYRITYTYSSKFCCKMLRLVDVPMFQGILIHAGNTVSDTQGCILVGLKIADGHLSASRLTYNRLISRLLNSIKQDELITISVE